MFKKWIFVLLIGGFLIAGCISTAAPEISTPTTRLSVSATPVSTLPSGTLTAPATTVTPSIAASTSIPNLVGTQSGGNGLTQNPVTLNKVIVSMQGENPAQPILQLQGSLPTPCDKLQVNVGKPDADNQIRVEVYLQSNPNQMCAQVIMPFTQIVPIKNLSSGKYTVWVNGKQYGSIEIP